MATVSKRDRRRRVNKKKVICVANTCTVCLQCRNLTKCCENKKILQINFCNISIFYRSAADRQYSVFYQSYKKHFCYKILSHYVAVYYNFYIDDSSLTRNQSRNHSGTNQTTFQRKRRNI